MGALHTRETWQTLTIIDVTEADEQTEQCSPETRTQFVQK